MVTAALPEVTLTAEADVAVTCTASVTTGPEERLLWESDAPSTTHTVELVGLLANSTYTCEVAPSCPRSMEPVTVVEVGTALNRDLPRATTTFHKTLTTTGPAFVLVNSQKYCDYGDWDHRLVAYDLHGRPGGTTRASPGASRSR